MGFVLIVVVRNLEYILPAIDVVHAVGETRLFAATRGSSLGKDRGREGAQRQDGRIYNGWDHCETSRNVDGWI